MKLRYTPRAQLDFAEIHDYIASENHQAARRVVLLIRKVAEHCCKTPRWAGQAG